MIWLPSKKIYTPLPRLQRGSVSVGPHGVIAAAGASGSGPTVIVAATKLIEDTEPGGTAYATVQVNSDGDLYQSVSGLNSGFTSYETWLDAGLNSQVWVQCDIVSGTLTASDGTGSRLACTTSRRWGIQSPVDGLKQTVVDLDFYDAASGGSLLDTQRVTLTADSTAD